MTDKRLIRVVEVRELTGLKRSAIYSRMEQAEFPRSIKLGTASRWYLPEIHAWIED